MATEGGRGGRMQPRCAARHGARAGQRVLAAPAPQPNTLRPPAAAPARGALGNASQPMRNAPLPSQLSWNAAETELKIGTHLGVKLLGVGVVAHKALLVVGDVQAAVQRALERRKHLRGAWSRGEA